ncbi:thymidylate synthase [Bacillus phage vB_BceS_LY1]|uniref:Thymidylate synthase n=1 Tax=Bacillus phage vB_BceS_LY1 TaxID=2950459 RepID=A0AAE9LV90_9CAUD|nr:thymidylate synthase [Bacillus phage vB_BceS_LY1]
MKVKLLAHSQVSQEFVSELCDAEQTSLLINNHPGKMIALSAIRTCYSPNKPSEVVIKEGKKYFGTKAKEGTGSEADRLIRFIRSSGHTSTLEHISFTFAIEGVSRALLAQLTRHRVGFSFSVQSQRYVKQSTDSRHGGFDYVIPEKVENSEDAERIFVQAMSKAQMAYDMLILAGVPQEDARAVLPNAATCNLVMTANLTALLGFYEKRKPGNGAQKEITDLAVALRNKVVETEPWTGELFDGEDK